MAHGVGRIFGLQKYSRMPFSGFGNVFFVDFLNTGNGVNANQKMSIFAEMECHFSAVSIAVYTALIHHFTCRLEARQALIYQLALGLTGENGKYYFCGQR